MKTTRSKPYVSYTEEISASHQLHEHKGKCKNIHGHNYVFTFSVSGPKDKKTGMVIDFDIIKKAVKPIFEHIDHRHLNDLFTFEPTAENIAEWSLDMFYNYMIDTIGEKKLTNLIVKVQETAKCSAEVWLGVEHEVEDSKVSEAHNVVLGAN